MICRRDVMACALLCLTTLPLIGASGSGAAGDQPERLLTNEGLVMLARAGYNERFLMELVQSKPYRFDTSVEGLVYLAKQGVSEKMVRMIITMQRTAEASEADRAAAEAAAAESEAAPVEAPTAARPGPSVPRGKPQPVRMRVVTQKMLVPESQSVVLGPNPTIVVEKRRLGADRYYAMPGAQPPVASNVVAPKRGQASAGMQPMAVTQVAAFH